MNITERKLKILVACEESQAVTIEFRKLGHEAYSADIQDCSGGYPEWHIKGDVLKILNDGWDMMIAHPPCTRLTNAGRRWLHNPPKGKTMVQMWSDFFDGVEFYRAIRSANIPKIAIENPVMHDHARELLGKESRNIVQPWWFGDKAFKATGFELINLPGLVSNPPGNLPGSRLIPPKSGTDEHKEWSKVHRMSPGPERTKLRSKTYPGIAKAIANQWGLLYI
ncbi:unnamed protein product [marine sediment metagenome]|uniref:DNA cytosine methyltransferase n=1 Tax=marine sediment metagenome TaxID=412755 RepID=X0T626_9ZZZZ